MADVVNLQNNVGVGSEQFADSSNRPASQKLFAKDIELRVDAKSASRNVDNATFMRAVEQVKKFLENNPKIALSVHVEESITGFVMSLQDPKTGFVKQFPSEEAVAVAQNIEKLKGILFDKGA